MEMLIAGLSLVVSQNNIKYKMPDIMRIVRMGADNSFVYN